MTMRVFQSIFSPQATTKSNPGLDLKNVFSLRSNQDTVRDDVVFAPAIDPYKALFDASRRMNAGQPLLVADNETQQKEDVAVTEQAHGRLFSAK